jgi:diguanylate cyclase (GGDEF)-like protein
MVFTTMTGLLLIAIAFLGYDYSSTKRDAAERLEATGRMVAGNSTAAVAFGDSKAAAEVLGTLKGEEDIQTACTYDSSNNVLAEYHRHPGDKCPLTIPTAHTVVLGSEAAYYCHPVLLHEGSVGYIYLKSDLGQMRHRRLSFLFLTVVFLLAAITVAGLLGLILGKWMANPVVNLASLMQSVSHSRNFALRATPRGNDEIGRLVIGFNDMLNELERREEEKKVFVEQLRFQASNDHLTGLPNRRLFADRLSQGVAAAHREKHALALLFIDLDGFKLVNDTLGHRVGDLLLVQVAERLRSRIRESDTLARLGGDEFTVILRNLAHSDAATTVSKTILDTLAQPFFIEHHQLTISASIGISLYPDHATDGNQLMLQADTAMYTAKREGKNRFMYFSSDLTSQVHEQMNLENELRNAVARGEIGIHYQPEFETLSGRLIRFEALARWTHPTLGTIPPIKFIPVAEESGVIVPLGAYILEQACREAVKWQSLSPDPIEVAVNVSSIQFARPTFAEEVDEILRRTALKPQLLQLELTESVMLNGIHRATETMKRLKSLGVSLAVDDFGTGYSCLRYLPELPLDALKIDRCFVKDVDLRPEARVMVDSLVTLAHNVGLRVIAEGIERAEELQIIKELKGDEIQGYMVGRPVPDPSAVIMRNLRTVSQHDPNSQTQPLLASSLVNS